MTKLFVLSVMIFAFGFIIESSAQFWRQPNGFAYPQRQFQRYYPNHHQSRQYQQQNGFQNNMQLPPGVSMSEAEWVCRNPKTGDMMIIAAEEGQTPNSGGNGQNVWQSANISTTEMPSSSEPLNPESTDSNYTDGEGVIDIRLGNKQASKDTNK